MAVFVIGLAFVTPSLQSLISRRTSPAQQGHVLGVTQSLSSFARIAGPVLGIRLFAYSPQVPLWSAAAIMAFAAVAHGRRPSAAGGILGGSFQFSVFSVQCSVFIVRSWRTRTLRAVASSLPPTACRLQPPASSLPKGPDRCPIPMTSGSTVSGSRVARSRAGLVLLFGTMYFVQGIAEPTEGLIAQPVRSLLKSWGRSRQ